MNVDINALNNEIDSVAKRWKTSGHIVLAQSGEILHQKGYGYTDREAGVKTKKDNAYTLSLYSPLLLGLAALKLIEDGVIHLEDSVSMYIPELKQGHLIHIKDLLNRRSGLVDYYYGVLMVALNAEESHAKLSNEDKLRAEQKCLNINRQFDKVLALINDRPLDFVPGTSGFQPSETELVILMTIVCRVMSLSPFEAMQELVFEPYQMTGVKAGANSNIASYKVFGESTLVRIPLDYEVEDVFTMEVSDAAQMVKGISLEYGLKKKTWKLATQFDEENLGLMFEGANGFACSRIEFLGNGLHLYFSFDLKLAFAALVNEEQLFEHVEGQWHFFRKSLRQAVDSLYTFPVNTKMVKINKENLWDALNITVDKSQLEFVLDAKSSIAMGLLYKTKKVFVQMEGTKAVGLLVLEIDHKRSFYDIDIIQIDKRFQGRGYGKLMLAFAVDYLKKAGAKELLIGVNRQNLAAQKIYMDAGFTPKKVSEGGMQLQMIISE